MEIPNMVNSNTCSNKIQKDENECIVDPGGYFIVNGGEKLMLCIEKQADNKPLVFMSKDGTGINAVNIYRIQIHSVLWRFARGDFWYSPTRGINRSR